MDKSYFEKKANLDLELKLGQNRDIDGIIFSNLLFIGKSKLFSLNHSF